MTDKEIMSAVRDGEIDKMSILFERYNVKLYNYFMKLTYKRQFSEDLVQEVFLRILKYRHTYNGKGVFTTWFFQVAHNLFYDLLKQEKKMVNSESVDDIPSESNVFKTTSDKEDEEILKKALLKLKENEREVLILSRYHNMKYEEIAKLTNCTVGTIKSRVHFAIKNLKNIYFDLAGEVKNEF